jgi:undecaprenyl-diphosphatase
MPLSHAIFLGLIQGLTEFLPISSSGHLFLIPRFLAWPEQTVAFDAVLHLATLLALVIFFRKEIGMIWRAFLKPGDRDSRRLAWIICIATVPSLIFGAVLEVWTDNPFRDVRAVTLSLIGWAIVMFLVDRFWRVRERTASIYSVNLKQGFFIGLAQAIALIPGTSRSGITITAGFFKGLDRATAARFSFLLAIPATAAAGLVSLFQLFKNQPELSLLPILAGFAVALASGYLAIEFLINFLQKHTLTVFVIYRLILGLILIRFFW